MPAITQRDIREILDTLDVSGVQPGSGTGSWFSGTGDLLESVTPITGRIVGKVKCAGKENCENIVSCAVEGFRVWKMVPAPKRGDIVRRIGNAFRECKRELGALVSLEMGKIRAEGEGEIQEMIDMTDFALGQSRMLYGFSMHSERPFHRMYEQWHPLGPVLVITSFNFPVAVWAWNAMLALVAGDTVIWKPSSRVPLSAVAVMKIAGKVLREEGLPEGILNILIGKGDSVGEALIRDPRIPLVSFTGSVSMGRHIGRTVKSRLGKILLELGGNNGAIVTSSADLKLATSAILFGAVGTAGQRCTSTRRVFIHKNIYPAFIRSLIKSYKQIRIGNPLDEKTVMGPLVDVAAVQKMQSALNAVREQGGRVLYGGGVLSSGVCDTGTYVEPCICEVKANLPVVCEETFAPILYTVQYETLEEAIRYNNEVPQGLSSSIFTNDLREAETFLSSLGSDCGIANVNTGTSGAEIGGAFGGEKDTGGGRESGSDAWKVYMRRQTCTINWSQGLPLAQNIHFEAG